jgi:hypothetical protein
MPKLPIRPRAKKPLLTVHGILAWADDFHANCGRWPKYNDGRVPGTADQTWRAADAALRVGNRGLPGGTTLAKLLLEHRGRRHWHLPVRLTVTQILAWADAHHTRTGEWPGAHHVEQIPNAPEGTTWVAVALALQRGKRGLRGKTSLAKLLEWHRGVRNRLATPDFTEQMVLAWADRYHDDTGEWPKYQDGSIAGTGETWCAVDTALFKGSRGFPGGDSLAKLLARHRGVRNKSELPHLTAEQLRAWARAHRDRTGSWPRVKSGAIPEAPGETWSGVNAALGVGMRGLPGGDSLAQFLLRAFGKRNPADAPRLSVTVIREWIVRHHRLRNEWPKYTSGPIEGVPGETWCAVDNALEREAWAARRDNISAGSSCLSGTASPHEVKTPEGTTAQFRRDPESARDSQERECVPSLSPGYRAEARPK